MLAFAGLARLPRPAKTLILGIVDAILGAAAFWLAALARSGRLPDLQWHIVTSVTLFVMALVPIAALFCGLYRPVIRFRIPLLSARAGLVSALTGSVVSTVGWVGGAVISHAIGIGVVFALVLFLLILLSRYAARILLGARAARGTPVAVYGAGDTGRQLVELLRRGHERYPVMFIDDDPSFHRRTIEGLPIVDPADRRFKDRLLSKDVKEILLAIPSVSASRRRAIMEFLGDLPFHVRSIPSLSELVNDRESALAQLNEVSIEELLGRESVSPLSGLLEKCVIGKVVLVSGGGGSIGSELCRQVLALRPERLIILDHSELALYQIEQELRENQPQLFDVSRICFALGSVTNPGSLTALMREHRVDTVYHAAAYKHVPIVEHNAIEGFRNNVLGTWYLARAAAREGARHFVLISSDKAVRPTNVMGATKRMAELVVQTQSALNSQMIFSMVRFGNVMGSSGSVVPRFRRQIERGGPVTLTHPDVTRYFMTIAEAVQLVIQAGAMAQGGEVFVLDMGEPIKIKDLAIKMIRLSGRTVRDAHNASSGISIDVVGLRPGEKLYEELLISGDATATAHPRIWQAREESVDAVRFEKDLHFLEDGISEGLQTLNVGDIMARWVTGYTNQSK